MKRKTVLGPATLFFLIWLLLLTAIPALLILAVSFLSRSPQGELLYEATLSNYARCFHWLYIRVLFKTLGLAGSATLTCLLVGFPVAYFLARSAGWLRQLGLILLFIPFWTNFILRVYGIVSLVGNHGLLNQLLLKSGLISEPLQILYTPIGVYLGLLYNYLPFVVVPIFSALEKFDNALREAAYDLGASRIQTFLRVVLPNIKEGVLIGSLFVFIPMLGEYVIPDLLGGAKQIYLGNLMVSQFFTAQDWPFGAAIAGLLSLFLILTILLQNKWQKTGVQHA
ncbi:MAG: ABC transporter permease [Deltaproteobacteria bacterium]|nr:ABC transporter permease [Deltaproteobacteria bacterium]